MRSWPSWLAIAFGALLCIAGLWLTNSERSLAYLTGFLLPGSVLLAAGLHALQASYDSWCDCSACAGGCGCCGDGCACGDCGECQAPGGHEGHDHDGGHDHSHEHAH